LDSHKNFSWSNDLSTSIEFVDDEHRALIQRYCVLGDVSQSLAPLAGFLKETGRLAVELQAHFLSEEQVMRNLQYSGYREHRAAHRCVIADLSDFIQNIGVGLSDKDLPAVNEYFRYSFINHVKEYDLKLRYYLDQPEPQPQSEPHRGWG
jgi:hemerythrin